MAVDRVLPFPGLIQVAGVHDEMEARMLADAGVHAVGIPLRLPVHAPDVTEREAAQIFASLPPCAVGVCITYLDDPGEIAAFCAQLGVRVVQLHGDVPHGALAWLNRLDPGLFVIKSLVVRGGDGEKLAAQLAACAPHVHAFITDTYDPATGADGATGKTHDWTVSRMLAERAGALDRPLILAGGLNADNVRRAIAQVRPHGVDAHTGLEDPDVCAGGRKNLELVRRFVREAREGFRDIARANEKNKESHSGF